MNFFEDTYRIINKYNQKNKTAKCYGTEDLLYPAEVHMIEIIGSYEKITTTKLAEVLGITKGAVSQVTRKLSEKALISKEASAEKTNEVGISLTTKGKTVYDYHRKMHEELLQKIDLIFGSLTEESKNAMERMIHAIDESLDEL